MTLGTSGGANKFQKAQPSGAAKQTPVIIGKKWVDRVIEGLNKTYAKKKITLTFDKADLITILEGSHTSDDAFNRILKKYKEADMADLKGVYKEMYG
jgi:hypothetical protein